MAHLKQPASKDIIITFVKGEGILLKFWGLPVSSLDIVKRFEAQFAKARFDLEQTSGFLNSNQTPIGFKGAVFSKYKRQWCRARVLQVLGYAELLVQLSDYGSEEVVNVTDIRSLDESYFRLPPQALECILADVIPAYTSEWSPDALRFCEQQLLMQTVTCCVVSQHLRRGNDALEKVPIVRIAKQGEMDPFVQRLINNGLALIKPEGQHHQMPQMPIQQTQPMQQLPIQQTQPMQQLPIQQSQPMQQLPIQQGYKMNKLDMNTTHLIKVSFIESAQKFYVQLAAVELELKKLMDEIKVYTVSENMQLLNAPIPYTPCLAQFSSQAKPVFYRAVVNSVMQGRCSILFVDYGCSETKDFQELRALPNRFLNLPAQAICCSLKMGDTASEACFVTGRNQLLNCHVLGFHGDAYVVRLAPHPPEAHRQLPRTITPPPLVYRRQTLDVGMVYEATVSYINDVTEFYIQLALYKDRLEQISSHLNSGAEFEPISLSECLPNTPVCVKFSEDHVWYRAQVMKVNHEADIEVFFVDFGNYDNASLRDIRKLKPDLILLPVQAYKCCLFETQPASDSNLTDEMFDAFEEMTTGQVLRAHIQAVTDGQCYAVTLKDNSQTSINEKIQSKFASFPKVPISDIEQLYVTFFTSADLFFGQFEKLSQDKLNQMGEELNNFYSNQRPIPSKPAIGSYVCAKFREDNLFYRARVDQIRGNECEVLFIDYGNRERVPLGELHHPLRKEFLALPPFGIECGLEGGCPPATPMEKLEPLFLNNTFQVKMLREENGKWLVTLTEQQCNVAVLELLRQHERLVPRSIHGAGLQGFQETTNRNAHQNQPQFNPVSNERGDAQLSNQSFDVISIPLNAFRHVYVSYVISPSEFYVQLDEDANKLDTLMKSIEDTYLNGNNTGLNLSKLATDSPCCALFEDGAWYRGQVKEVGPRESSVYFIDYGNTDSVSNSTIKALMREFFCLPPQAIRCKSFNVTPIGKTWSDSEIDTFSEMTLEKKFVSQFVELDASGVYGVNLVSADKLQEEALNKKFVSIVKGGSAEPHKSEVPAQPNRSETISNYNRQSTSSTNNNKSDYQPPPPKQIQHVAALSNLTLQLPRVQVGTREAVIVHYGLNPGEVFCQLKSSESDFKKMMFDLQTYYGKVPASSAAVNNPHPKMVCIAQFFQDMAWYRAEVKTVDRNNLTVCYVDYGNCETVDKQKIRSITEKFASLPIQGVKCRLKGIRPPGPVWPTNQNISRYYEGESQCHFIEKEGDCFIVDIICNNKNVAQQLVNDGLAANDGPSNVAQTTKAQAKQSIPGRKSTFVNGQLLSIVVSYVDSPYKFWCQLLDEAESLEQLMADIEAQYMEADNLPIDASNLTVGFYCMAKYSADEAWYRVQIKSCLPGGKYEVLFIDYGNSEVTSSNQLAAIQDQFLSLPPQCLECRLHRSTTNSGKAEEFQAMANEVEEWTAKVESVSGGVCVLTLLYEKDGEEVNASDLLFGEAAVTAAPTFPPCEIPLGGPSEGYVTEVTSPRDFFVQLASVEDPLAELSTKLSDECEAGGDVLACPLTGSACAAKYVEDNNWYRAEIIGLQESTADVLFVDYGNVNSVPLDTLRVLPPSFLQVPPYAIKCKLNGIIPNGEQWTDAAIDHFKDTVLDSLLNLTFISKDVPAAVNISKEDKDVAQGMVDMELACVETCPEETYVDDHLTAVEDQLHSLPVDFSYPKRKLVTDKLQVKICYVDSCSKFYCMPLELSTELDTVMKTLEILYSPSEENKAEVNVLEDPSPSMACVAKFSEDEAWYRANITSMEGDNINVMFVDYGNYETTTLENLRPLTPELIKIPPIAVECNLYGLKVVEGKEQEVIAKLEELCIEESELEMEIIQSTIPYSVKLYQDGDLSEFFIKEGMAVLMTPQSETIDEETVVSINDNVKENLQTAFVELQEERKCEIPLRHIVLGEDLCVSVKFSEIADDMMVIYAVPNELDNALAEYQDKLQETYNQLEGRLDIVNCDDFCVAKYAEDELWYRAQVVSTEEDNVRVKFIDYGNSEIVSINSIGKLIPEFMSEPQFAVKFCLSGCKVRQDKSDDLQFKIDELIYNEPLTVNTCKYSHSLPAICVIDLVCGGSSIVELFLNEKLLLHQFTVNSQLSEKFEATIKSIVDGVFYILPKQFEEDRDKLQARLSEVCDASASVVELDTGRLYAAKVEGCWYRVAISETTSDSALVKCFDYGLDAELEISELKMLSEDLCHFPLLLPPCLISNLDDAPEIVKNQVIEKLVGCVFHCEVLNGPPTQLPLEIRISEKGLVEDLPAEPILDVGKESDVEINGTTKPSIEDEISLGNDTSTVIEEKIKDADILDTKIKEHTDDESKVVDATENESKTDVSVETPVTDESLSAVANALSVDALKSIEDDLSAYSDMVSDIEKESPVCVAVEELICNVENKEPSVADGVANDIECRAEAEGYVSGDDLEEPILKKSAFVCGEEKEESVLSSSDALAEDERNQDSEFEEFQSDDGIDVEESISSGEVKPMEVSEGSLDDMDASSEEVDDHVNELPENDLANVELLEKVSRPSFKQSLDVQNDLVMENGFKGDNEEMSFEIPDVGEDTSAEADIGENSKMISESQEPESEAMNYLPKDDKNLLIAESDNAYEEIEDQCSPESDDNVKIRNDTESAEADVKVLDTHNDTESAEADVKVLDTPKALNNEGSTVFSYAEALKCRDNSESSDSIVLQSKDITETAEAESLENVAAAEDIKKIDNKGILEAKGDDPESIEDLVESGKLEESPKDSIVEDNEWDERPECDIKPDAEANSTISDNVQQIKNLLRDLIGTSWHKMSGKLNASISGIDVVNEIVVISIQPSPEDLGSALFNAFKNAYSEREQDIEDPSVSNLCAVNFAGDWYRAKIVEVKEDTLKVSLIDIDTIETVLPSALRDLDIEHKAPVVSVQCSLASARCKSENSTALKDFLSSLKDTSKETVIELLSATNSSTIEINLLLDGQSVLPKLIAENLVLQKVAPFHIPPEKHCAKISHMSANLELYVHLISKLDDLKELKESMQAAAYPSSAVPMVESGVYAIQHNGDWLRAEAISSGEELSLRLLDTGETVPSVATVYSLLPEHCLHPPYAVPCKISTEIRADCLDKVKDAFASSEFVVVADSSGVCTVDESSIEKVLSLAELGTKET